MIDMILNSITIGAGAKWETATPSSSTTSALTFPVTHQPNWWFLFDNSQISVVNDETLVGANVVPDYNAYQTGVFTTSKGISLLTDSSSVVRYADATTFSYTNGYFTVSNTQYANFWDGSNADYVLVYF